MWYYLDCVPCNFGWAYDLKNFIIPIGIGIACYFAGTLLVMELKDSIILYTPYTMFFYTGLPEYNYVKFLNWFSLGYTILFLVIGFLDFRRKRMMA